MAAVVLDITSTFKEGKSRGRSGTFYLCFYYQEGKSTPRSPQQIYYIILAKTEYMAIVTCKKICEPNNLAFLASILEVGKEERN